MAKKKRLSKVKNLVKLPNSSLLSIAKKLPIIPISKYRTKKPK